MGMRSFAELLFKFQRERGRRHRLPDEGKVSGRFQRCFNASAGRFRMFLRDFTGLHMLLRQGILTWNFRDFQRISECLQGASQILSVEGVSMHFGPFQRVCKGLHRFTGEITVPSGWFQRHFKVFQGVQIYLRGAPLDFRSISRCNKAL